MKDICAVSTPLAEGGISVIRISGENAISIGAKVFKPLSCKSVENMEGYSCAYGKIVDKNGREVDDGVLTVFRAPKSYTGEKRLRDIMPWRNICYKKSSQTLH